MGARLCITRLALSQGCDMSGRSSKVRAITTLGAGGRVRKGNKSGRYRKRTRESLRGVEEGSLPQGGGDEASHAQDFQEHTAGMNL